METKGRTIASILIVVAISYCLLGITGMLPPQYDLIPKEQGTSVYGNDFTLDHFTYESAKSYQSAQQDEDGNIWLRYTETYNTFYKIDEEDDITAYEIPSFNTTDGFYYIDGYILMWVYSENTMYRFNIQTEEFDSIIIQGESLRNYDIMDSNGNILLIDDNTDIIYKVSSDLTYTTTQINESINFYYYAYDNITDTLAIRDELTNTIKLIADNGTVMNTFDPNPYFTYFHIYQIFLIDGNSNIIVGVNEDNGFLISTFNYVTNQTTNASFPYEIAFFIKGIWSNDHTSIWLTFDYSLTYLVNNPYNFNWKIVNYDFNQFWDFDIPNYNDNIGKQVSSITITSEGYLIPDIWNTKNLYVFTSDGEVYREISLVGFPNVGGLSNTIWNQYVLNAWSSGDYSIINFSSEGSYENTYQYGRDFINMDINNDNGDVWTAYNTYNEYPQFIKTTKSGVVTGYTTLWNTQSQKYVVTFIYNEENDLIYLYVNDNGIRKFVTWNPETDTYGTLYSPLVTTNLQSAVINSPDGNMWIIDARVTNNKYCIWKFNGIAFTQYIIPFYRERAVDIKNIDGITYVITQPNSGAKNRIWKMDSQGVWTPLMTINNPTMNYIPARGTIYNPFTNTIINSYRNSTSQNVMLFIYYIADNTTQYLDMGVKVRYSANPNIALDNEGNLWFDLGTALINRSEDLGLYRANIGTPEEEPSIPDVTQEDITLSYDQIGNWNSDNPDGITEQVGNDITVRVHLESPDGIETAQIVYTPIVDGTYDTVTKTVDMVLVEGDNEDGYWEGDIPAQQGTGTLAFYVYATSETGGELRTPTTYVTITEQGQETPTPSAPSADLRTAFYAGSIGILLIVGVAINRPPARWRY